MCSLKSRAENVGYHIKITTGPTFDEKYTLPFIYTEKEAMELAAEILCAIYRNKNDNSSGRIQILFDDVPVEQINSGMDERRNVTGITKEEIEELGRLAEDIEKYTKFGNMIGLDVAKDNLRVLLDRLNKSIDNQNKE